MVGGMLSLTRRRQFLEPRWARGLAWTVKAQAAEVALDLGESDGGRIDSKSDGSCEGVHRVDGDKLDLSCLDSRLDPFRKL